MTHPILHGHLWVRFTCYIWSNSETKPNKTLHFIFWQCDFRSSGHLASPALRPCSGVSKVKIGIYITPLHGHKVLTKLMNIRAGLAH